MRILNLVIETDSEEVLVPDEPITLIDSQDQVIRGVVLLADPDLDDGQDNDDDQDNLEGMFDEDDLDVQSAIELVDDDATREALYAIYESITGLDLR
jgi:hypothetical protein